MSKEVRILERCQRTARDSTTVSTLKHLFHQKKKLPELLKKRKPQPKRVRRKRRKKKARKIRVRRRMMTMGSHRLSTLDPQKLSKDLMSNMKSSTRSGTTGTKVKTTSKSMILNSLRLRSFHFSRKSTKLKLTT
jgi:hypothetical protein